MVLSKCVCIDSITIWSLFLEVIQHDIIININIIIYLSSNLTQLISLPKLHRK